MASILDNVLGGAGSLLGSVGSGIMSIIQPNREQNFNAEQAEINRSFQSAEAQRARDYNTEMWNAQNEYNTPEAQLERLLSTGMNPATAVGMLSGNGNGNSQLASSGAQAAGSQASATGSAVNAVGNAAANAVGNAANVMKTMQEAKGLEIDNKYKPIKNDKDIELVTNQILETFASKEEKDANAEQIRQMLPLLKGKSRAEISNLWAATGKVQQEINNLITENGLLNMQTLTEMYKQNQISADTWESLTRGGLNLEQAATEASVRAKNYAEAEQASTQADVNRQQVFRIFEESFIGLYDIALRESGYIPGLNGNAQLFNISDSVYTSP